MREANPIRGIGHAAVLVVLVSLAFPICYGQSSDQDAPLGDIARSYRKDKKPPEKTVIDNENIAQLMDEIQTKKFSSNFLFSFDSIGRNFKVSSPDVTCSLSFNAQASSLLSNPYVSRDLPNTELGKLDGPAVIHGNMLEVSVYNGSEWNVKELTVGITTVRRSVTSYGPKLQPAAEKTVETLEKRSDQTVLYHLKGVAAPSTTTVFTGELPEELGPDQEWHWAIVGAKGVPPSTATAGDPTQPASAVAPSTNSIPAADVPPTDVKPAVTPGTDIHQ